MNYADQDGLWFGLPDRGSNYCFFKRPKGKKIPGIMLRHGEEGIEMYVGDRGAMSKEDFSMLVKILKEI